LRWIAAVLITLLVGLAFWVQAAGDDSKNLRLATGRGDSASTMASSLAPPLNPAPKNTPETAPEALLPVELHDFKSLLLGPKFNLQSCASTLEVAETKVLLTGNYTTAIKSQPRSLSLLSDLLFQIKNVLRMRMKEFGDELVKNAHCQIELRRSFHQLRTLEDLLGEKILNFPDEDDDGRPRPLTGTAPYLMMASGYPALDLQSGDVLVSRGTTFMSSAVARLGGSDSTLSHLEILYIDPITKKQWVVGSAIDLGHQVRSLDAYLNASKVRILVFRYLDGTVAHKVAEQIYQQVSSESTAPSTRKKELELFGAAFITQAFSRIAAKNAAVPLIESQLHAQHTNFVERLGIHATHLVLPSDIEMDWRFSLVAEWRDFGLVNMSHMREAVLNAIFDWMEQDNYVLKGNSETSFAKLVVDHLPNWPVFPHRSDFATKEILGPSAVVDAFKELDAVGEVLYSHLEEVADSKSDSNGSGLTPSQMHDELEAFRKVDLKIYQEYQKTHSYDPLAKKPSFHLLFRH
jgi:hypothetical protein